MKKKKAARTAGVKADLVARYSNPLGDERDHAALHMVKGCRRKKREVARSAKTKMKDIYTFSDRKKNLFAS